MTNEEAVKQIARGLAVSDEYPHDYLSAYAGAIQAMKWKDSCLGNWLDTLNKEIDKLTTGNLAHNKTHIKCLLYEIQEQLKGE